VATDTRGDRRAVPAAAREAADTPPADTPPAGAPPAGADGRPTADGLIPRQATRSSRRPPAAARRPRRGSQTALTGRGGLVIVAGCTMLGAFADGALGLRSAQGLFFVVGCLIAALRTRRADLLTLVVSPPLLFLLVSLSAAVAGSFGARSFLVSVLVAVATALMSNVFWLFAGALLTVAVAVPRGLPAAVRDLRARVAADNPFRGRTSLRGRKDADDDPVRWDETPAE
jgi:hypothetical protein